MLENSRYSFTSATPLPRVFGPYLKEGDPCTAVIVAPGPRVPDFETDAGISSRYLAPAVRPTTFGPESALAALANRQPAKTPAPRPSNVDLAAILDAWTEAIKDELVVPQAGPPGNDPRPYVLRDACATGTAAGIPPVIVAMTLAKITGEDQARLELYAAADGPYNGSWAAEVLRRRDERNASKLAETKAAKVDDERAKRPNGKSARQLGRWMFRKRTVLRQPDGFGVGIPHSDGFTYYLHERYGALPAFAETFDGDLEVMADDFVLTVAESRIRKSDGYHEHAMKLVLRSRAAHVDTRPIDLAEMLSDETLEGEWLVALAERTARPWLDTYRPLHVSALVRGLLVEPATAEELLISWRADDRALHVSRYGEEATRVWDVQVRQDTRASIAEAMAGGLHSPGELRVAPTKEQLDALALSTGRDPLRGFLAKTFGGKREVTGEEIDEALRSAKYLEGTPTTSFFSRIKAAFEAIGFEKKNVSDDVNPSGKKKAFVRVGGGQ